MRFNVNGDMGRFYQMPQVLFIDPEYRKLNSNAKVIYSILADRMKLSVANNFVNEKGEVYFVYDENDLSELSGISARTLTTIRKQLVKVGLLEVERTGRANIYYLHYARVTPESMAQMMQPDPFDPTYDPSPKRSEDGRFESQNTRNAKIADLDPKDLESLSEQDSDQIGKNCGSETQKLQASYTDSSYTNDDDEKGNKTPASAHAKEPVDQLLEIVSDFLEDHQVPPDEIKKVLAGIRVNPKMIDGRSIVQQMQRTIDTAQQKGLYSFSSYFLGGLAKLTLNKQVRADQEAEKELKWILDGEEKDLPKVSLVDWLDEGSSGH